MIACRMPQSPLLLPLLLAAIASACASTDLTSPDPAGPLHHLIVSGTGGARVVLVGEELQLVVSGFDAIGYEVHPGRAEWRGLDPSIATISADGRVRGLVLGDARIEVRAGGLVTEFLLLVRRSFCTATGSTAILPGTPRSGLLSMSDCAFPSGGTADGWLLQLDDSALIRLAVNPGPPGVRVWVTDSRLNEIERTYGVIDDFGFPDELRPAPAKLVALKAGSYRVWVATAMSGGGGSYSLSVDRVSRCEDATPVPLALGGTTGGSLARSDCHLSLGLPADVLTMQFSDTRYVAIVARSAEFTPVVRLTMPMGRFEFFSQVPLSTHSDGDSVTTTIYRHWGGFKSRIWVFGAGGERWEGAYELETREMLACPESEPPELVPGLPVGGTLGLEDCWLAADPGPLVELWRFTLSAPTRVRLDLDTGPINRAMQLRLLNSDGSDRNTPLTFPSDGVTRIEGHTPAGTYTVVVSSGGSLGAYALTLTHLP